ncbi:NAD(P)-binding protein [Penicillium malachiteum]|uniref:NAD(P)-binding protein n=1 Tax=Penicillium malachiteum TaxID=1324776 RepID=UPI002547368C|nr:NAD(P)-binding protein [Penicillium malachiteum]KAJ5737773.1 NAD(P)-binding protein [Penicillium malachiteum]
MLHNILLTGGSGYIGGTLLARWKEAGLAEYGKLFSLVRTDAQAETTQDLYGVEPLRINLEDEEAVKKAIVSNKITVVLYLIDAYYFKHQIQFIKALAQAKKETGQEVHFIYTTGTKQFSDMGGAPSDKDLLDNDPELFEIHKAQKATVPELQIATNTNISVVEAGVEHGLTLNEDGKGEGFGNKISIQTVDIVIAAKATGRVYEFDRVGQIWPVAHILDTVSLYFALLTAILEDKNPSHGKNGFYLASSGKVAWHDIYTGIADALARRAIIEDGTVHLMNDTALEKIAKAQKVPSSCVVVKIGGRSTYTAENGKSLGWKPQYPPEHILQVLDKEVEGILEGLDSKHSGLR